MINKTAKTLAYLFCCAIETAKSSQIIRKIYKKNTHNSFKKGFSSKKGKKYGKLKHRELKMHKKP